MVLPGNPVTKEEMSIGLLSFWQYVNGTETIGNGGIGWTVNVLIAIAFAHPFVPKTV